MRFYDPESGDIYIDDINIKDYDILSLRKQIGIVSQEPVLFNGTIEYNIKYTKEDATMDEIKEAARKANALDFIEKNDFEVLANNDQNDDTNNNNKDSGSGFQKKVGSKGNQISGGQK